MKKRSLLVALFASLVMASSSAHAVFIGDSTGNLYNLNVSTNTSTLIGNSGVGAFSTLP